MNASKNLGVRALDAALILDPVGPTGSDATEHRFALDIPDGWQQGRGAFGGLVIGALVRAMTRVTPGARHFRSVTAEIPAPVMPGATEIHVSVLRAGRSLSTLHARLLQKGTVLAHATGIYGATRETTTDIEFGLSPSPLQPNWRPAAEVPAAPKAAFATIPFAQHFEFRVTGPLPFAGADEARAEGWVQLRAPLTPDASDSGATMTPAALVALADAYWPAFFATLRRPRSSATVAFTMHATPASRALRPDEALYYRAIGEHCSEGYCAERRELYTADGSLVAINNQTFTIIK